MTGNQLNTPATGGASLRAGRKLDSRPEIAGPISHNAMQIK